MPLYAREDLDRIRDATDFVALVEQRVELERAGGGNFKCLCPFHDERSPSMSIKADDKLFHCFGCQEGGDLFRWVELTEGVDFTGAVELLADRAGIQLKTEEEDPETAQRRKRERRLLELLDRTNRFYERQLWESPEGAQARAELQRRGLDPELLKAFRVGYAPSAWDRVLVGSRHAGYTQDEMVAAGVVMQARDNPGRLYDRFRRRITFPLADPTRSRSTSTRPTAPSTTRAATSSRRTWPASRRRGRARSSSARATPTSSPCTRPASPTPSASWGRP
jgi:DNA primase